MCQEYALPLQGRGGSTGYDSAVALPARSDSEELAKENIKSTQSLKGEAVFSVAKVGCGALVPHGFHCAWLVDAARCNPGWLKSSCSKLQRHTFTVAGVRV